MEKNTETPEDNYCRACLIEMQNLSKVEKSYKIYPGLVEMFVACSKTKVSEGDVFPKQLCNYCYDKLIKFHEFQEMCIRSLRQFEEIRKSHIKTEANENSSQTAVVQGVKKFDRQTNSQISFRTKRLQLRNSNKNFEKKFKKNKASNVLLKCSQENEAEFIIENLEEKLKQRKCIVKEKKQIRSHSDDATSEPCSFFFKCEICPMRFFVEHRLIAHKRAHDGLIPYPCPQKDCKRGFKRWHCLNEHLKQHEGTNKWFVCAEDGCERRYKHKTTLDMHMRRYHKKGPELKSFVCEICGKVFKSSAILNDHRFTHKDKSELPFACEQTDCKYRFSNKEKLKVHLMRHAGIKKFQCSFCGMKKTTRNELKIHINYHTLERTFPCRFCAQVCNSAGNLKVHVRTVHERAKDYACRFCERTFAKPDTRKYHEMIHTGEKPHQCVECGKRFVQPAALRTHKKIHERQQSQSSSSNVGTEIIESLKTIC